MRNKEFKSAVLSAIFGKAEFSYNDIIDKVKPHANYDSNTLEEKQLKRDILGIIRSVRDKAGERNILSDSKGRFINIEITEDVTALGDVKGQLLVKIDGLNKSVNKVNRREKELEGQLSIFDGKENLQ